MQRKLLAGALIGAVVLSVAGSAASLLRDMREHWAAASVGALQAMGLVAGMPQGTFEPDTPFTRSQMAKLLVLGLGQESDAQALTRHASRFTDVPHWHWATGYVEALAELQIAEGYPDGRFGPEDGLTRAQLAVLLVRAAGLSSTAASVATRATAYTDDHEIPAWARGAVIVAQQQEIMRGLPDGSFAPDRIVSRAAGATAVMRFLQAKGRAYHQVGTLLSFNPYEQAGELRDAMGVVRSFKMDLNALYFRQGIPTTVFGPQPLDQVWLVLNAEGKGLYLSVEYRDTLVTDVRVSSGQLEAVLPDGSRSSWPVLPGAHIFHNGRPVQLQVTTRAEQAYLVFDEAWGGIRILDMVSAPHRGEYLGADLSRGLLVVLDGATQRTYQFTDDLVVVRDWEVASLTDLGPGLPVRYALSPDGRTVTYIQAER